MVGIRPVIKRMNDFQEINVKHQFLQRKCSHRDLGGLGAY